MEKHYSIAEAKSRLPAIVHGVEEGPGVKLTRHGKPVAVLLSMREYERLASKKKGFWDALTEFREALERAGEEIIDADFSDLRDTSSGRDGDLQR